MRLQVLARAAQSGDVLQRLARLMANGEVRGECAERIESVLETLVELLAADGAALYRWDGSPERLQGVEVVPPGAPHLSPQDILAGAGVVGQVWTHGSPVVVEDYASWPHGAAPGLELGIRTAVGLPLRGVRGAHGALVVWRRRPGARLTGQEATLLELLARELALEAERQRLEREACQASRLLRALVEMPWGSGRWRGAPRPLQELVEEARRLLNGAAPIDRAGQKRWVLEDVGDGRAGCRPPAPTIAGQLHDLRNLLTLAAGRAEMLRARVRDGQAGQDALLAGLELLVEALGEGVDTLQRLQRGSGDGPAPRARSVSLAALVQQAVDLTRPRWESKVAPVQVSCEIAPGLGAIADPIGLRDALVNLILNALDAMPNGGRLRLSGAQDGDWVILEIADSGVGMDETVRRRVFQPFFTTKGERGSGLGLTMVRSVVERHGGRVELSSAPGDGTTVRLWLPAAVPVARPVCSAGQSSEDGDALAVLVVDDEPGLARVLGQLLESAGYRAVLCSSAAEALAAFAPGRFDAVVTDLDMPLMDGLTLAQRLRASDARLGIVLATGWGQQVCPEQAAAAGIDTVLTKPYRADSLTAAVRHAAASRRAAGREGAKSS